MKNLKLTVCSLILLLSHPLFAQESPPEPPPALVEVDSVRTQDIAEYIWVPGTVVSRTDSDIASEVAGRITWMADVGDLLEEGQVLAKLDDHMLRLQAEQNQSNIAKWEAQVDMLTRKQQRFSAMADLNATSKDALDEVISQLEIARQELAQARVQQRLTDYQIAQTQVKAPFAAMVVARLQTPGEYTSVGQTLLRIVDTANVEASIRAPLSAVPYIHQGSEVQIKTSYAERSEKIRTIVPVGNALSRMMEVRVALEPGDFPIGSAVRVALPHSNYHQGMTVPRDALVLRKSGAYIYQVDADSNARQVAVKTGAGMGERIEVFGELQQHEPVVVRGAERLRPGQKVRFNETDEELARR